MATWEIYSIPKNKQFTQIESANRIILSQTTREKKKKKTPTITENKNIHEI